MSIYKQLNPRLLVQVGMGLGLLHWANMSNISLTLSFKLKTKNSIKAWGWISMRRCLKECPWRNHNAKCANWPILEFQMKKRSSKLESTEKLSKIGPVGNFDFWSKVNAKSQSQSQLVRVKVNGYWSGSVPGFRVGSRVEQ